MQAIRTIVTSSTTNLQITIPEEMKNKELEIIKVTK